MANGTKVCADCHAELPLDNFGTHARPNRIVGKRYVNSYCRPCSNSREPSSVVRDRRLRQRYGITSEQFDSLLSEQGGCAACGRSESNGKYWHVDHDHACCPTDARSCGRCIRGVLCHGCNTALGNVGDSVETLTALIEYIRKGAVIHA